MSNMLVSLDEDRLHGAKVEARVEWSEESVHCEEMQAVSGS